jgi:hypothetical protein
MIEVGTDFTDADQKRSSCDRQATDKKKPGRKNNPGVF